MIQRIQTFFLILVAVISGVLPFVLNLWIDGEGVAVFAENELWISVVFYISAALALISIFMFKTDKSICIEQIEYDIESFFTRIFRLSITKLIRRKHHF